MPHVSKTPTLYGDSWIGDLVSSIKPRNDVKRPIGQVVGDATQEHVQTRDIVDSPAARPTKYIGQTM